MCSTVNNTFLFILLNPMDQDRTDFVYSWNSIQGMSSRGLKSMRYLPLFKKQMENHSIIHRICDDVCLSKKMGIAWCCLPNVWPCSSYIVTSFLGLCTHTHESHRGKNERRGWHNNNCVCAALLPLSRCETYTLFTFFLFNQTGQTINCAPP